MTCDRKHRGASCSATCWLDQPIGEEGARRIMAEMDTRRWREANKPERPRLGHVVYVLRVTEGGDLGGDEIYLRAGSNSELLALRMTEWQARTLAIVTSTNPHGEVLTAEENERRWALLVSICDANGYTTHRVKSRPGCGANAHEDLLAIENVTQAFAYTLAKRFEQVAFVWIALGLRTAIPELIFVENGP